MVEVRWIKITTDMFDDEKIAIIESMPEADAILVIWVRLLVLAGKVNNGGLIYVQPGIPYTDEMLSSVMKRPINTIRLALQTLQKFKMIESLPDGIFVINWSKHQNMDVLNKIREDTRLRVAKFREKQRLLLSDNNTGNVTVTLPVTLRNDIRSKKEEVRSSSSGSNSSSSASVNKLDTEIYDMYSSEIGAITPEIERQLVYLVNNYSKDSVLKAISSSVTHNKRYLAYIIGTVNRMKNVNGDKKENPDKYFQGKYGHMVQR